MEAIPQEQSGLQPSTALTPASASDMVRKKLNAKRSSNHMSTAVGGRDDRMLFITLNVSDGTLMWQDGVNGPTPDMMDQTPDENVALGFGCLMGRRFEKFEL